MADNPVPPPVPPPGPPSSPPPDVPPAPPPDPPPALPPDPPLSPPPKPATPKAALDRRKLNVAAWSLLLFSVLAFFLWGLLTRSTGEQITAKAQVQPHEEIYWKVGFPRIGGTYDITNVRPVQIVARGFGFYGWNGARFDLYLSAAAPLEGASENPLGGSDLRFESKVIHLSADEPISMGINYYAGPTWRSLEFGRSTISIVSFLPFSQQRIESERAQRLHGVAQISGVAGTPFALEASEAEPCQVACIGNFADYLGIIYPTDPPQFRGPGSDGINRISIAALAEPSNGEPSQAFSVFAEEVRELQIQEFAEEIVLRAKDGILYLHGQPFPLSSETSLTVVFDEPNVGQIQIAYGDPATISFSGIARDVRLGEKTLMPRVIDDFPWYVQFLLGMIATFCVERLYASTKKAESSP